MVEYLNILIYTNDDYLMNRTNSRRTISTIALESDFTSSVQMTNMLAARTTILSQDVDCLTFIKLLQNVIVYLKSMHFTISHQIGSQCQTSIQIFFYLKRVIKITRVKIIVIFSKVLSQP